MKSKNKSKPKDSPEKAVLNALDELGNTIKAGDKKAIKAAYNALCEVLRPYVNFWEKYSIASGKAAQLFASEILKAVEQ